MTRSPIGAVVLYIALAYGGAWALLAPTLSAGADLARPAPSVGVSLATIAMMFTPAASAFAVTVLWEQRRRSEMRDALGLQAFFSRGAWKAALWSALAAAGLVIGSWTIGLLLGWLDLDPERSVAKDLIVDLTGDDPPMPMALLAVLQLLNLPLGLAITSVAAAGEEIGWRGWLLPRLLPLGRTRALVLSGAIWGLWHAPAILLGLNYEQPNILGVGMMVIACTGLGALIGWIRLRSASLLPCVIAHAALNVVATYQSVLFPAFDQVLTGPLSLTGWALMATVLVFALGRAKREARVPGM